jgi:hypothetical protein
MEDGIRVCYERQKECMKVGSWAENIEDESQRIELGFV